MHVISRSKDNTVKLDYSEYNLEIEALYFVRLITQYFCKMFCFKRLNLYASFTEQNS